MSVLSKTYSRHQTYIPCSRNCNLHIIMISLT
jgi:hypothetical protein